MQGEEVSPSVAQQKPTIKYDAESNQFFTLLMTGTSHFSALIFI